MAEALDPILPRRIDALATQVLVEADLRRLRLATAESCTGGLLASLLTDIPLRSHVFERGFVAYSNEAKRDLLGVPQAVLNGPGPVSEQAAAAMVRGAFAASRADVAVSITGWAESGPDPQQPGGLVWFACAARGNAPLIKQEMFGDIGRARLRVACLETALRLMLRVMTGRG